MKSRRTSGRRVADALREVVAAHLRHHDVGEQEIDLRQLVEQALRLARQPRGEDVVAGALEHAADELAHRRLVLDEQDRLGAAGERSGGRPPRSVVDRPRRGRQIDRESRAARLGRSRTSMPPPLCATIPYTVERPRPVPIPSCFVVKNGSKMCGRTSSAIPGPSSATASVT